VVVVVVVGVVTATMGSGTSTAGRTTVVTVAHEPSAVLSATCSKAVTDSS
jgi:hypothetical protein